jgi:hypothetical protein
VCVGDNSPDELLGVLVVELHAAGVLAALAAAVFAAQCASGRAVLVLSIGSIAAAAVALSSAAPLERMTLGFCVVAAAVVALTRPRWWWLAPAAAGGFGGAWISILEAQGLPWLPAALAAGVLLVATVGVAQRRREFMSAELRDEALVLVASLALLLAVGPDVVAGWRSSVALKSEPLAAAGPEIGPWLGTVVVAAVLLGGAYSLWKRR